MLFSTLYKYLCIVLFLALLALTVYCKFLFGENASLETENEKAKTILVEKQTALDECSKNTESLVAQSKAATDAARKAVEEAQKQSKINYNNATSVLSRPPKQPVVTDNNAQNYGGTDNQDQLKDYLATQDLANEYIDRRAK